MDVQGPFRIVTRCSPNPDEVWDVYNYYPTRHEAIYFITLLRNLEGFRVLGRQFRLEMMGEGVWRTCPETLDLPRN